MSKLLATFVLSLTVMVGTAGLASATPVLYFTNSDGAKYLLDETHTGTGGVGSVYTFTFQADFTGVTTSNALGDYALLISFKSKDSATWTTGSLLAAPGTDGNWQIVQDDSNSNGCKAGGSSTEWCIELKHTLGSTLTGPQIATGTKLLWQNTMTLTGGTLNFDVNWPFKFTTTTGVLDISKPESPEWTFGGYQISQEMLPCSPTVPQCNDLDINPLLPTPEPAGFVLLGTGLVGLAMAARRRKRA